MYSVDFYGRMIADLRRTDAYVSALQKTVKPGSVVIDLGCGPGFFGLLACKLGARRVYAIEPDKVIQIARDSARANGLSDRVEFIQAYSTKVSLLEQADVIVADLRGVLPLFGMNLPSIQDACNRFLAPGGVLIPERDRLFAALAQNPTRYQKLVESWDGRDGVSLAPGRQVVVNTWFKSRVQEDDLLCMPVKWHNIDYYNITSFDVCSEISFKVWKPGMAHGIAVWFESELCNGITLSNSPNHDELIYGNAFFPLSQPIDVSVGDEVQLKLRADLIKDDYVWTWETKVYDQKNSGSVKTHFKQSTLLGVPLSPTELRKRASSYMPVATEDGQVTSYIVSQMDGKATNEELAQMVATKFPDLFPAAKDALDVVADISVRFSE
jgi:protein arginine N-methyltransferase 1